ncbi:hypothetical protein PIB30_092900 [Stylosanthes scabra]|uniref:Uncharacterized protein n=1 Tax=Stylosanthes scabra TaxID=79078 RepID=A0ABU6UXM3_9FABA|nr:hypothetical protein [Stylosanthes scabra]
MLPLGCINLSRLRQAFGPRLDGEIHLDTPHKALVRELILFGCFFIRYGCIGIKFLHKQLPHTCVKGCHPSLSSQHDLLHDLRILFLIKIKTNFRNDLPLSCM